LSSLSHISRAFAAAVMGVPRLLLIILVPFPLMRWGTQFSKLPQRVVQYPSSLFYHIFHTQGKRFFHYMVSARHP
jgi:hypothetical protein